MKALTFEDSFERAWEYLLKNTQIVFILTFGLLDGINYLEFEKTGANNEWIKIP